MNHEIRSSLETAKRACSRCNAHRTFRPSDEDREIAYKSCRRAHELLNTEFDEMRRRDETTNEQLKTLKEAKKICLDAADACKTCNKEQPLVRQMLIDLK